MKADDAVTLRCDCGVWKHQPRVGFDWRAHRTSCPVYGYGQHHEAAAAPLRRCITCGAPVLADGSCGPLAT